MYVYINDKIIFNQAENIVIKVWLSELGVFLNQKRRERGVFLNQKAKSLKDLEHGVYTIYERGKNTRYSKAVFSLQDKSFGLPWWRSG